MFTKGLLALAVAGIILLVSCTVNEVSNSKQPDPDAIYLDYNIWGDEESGNVTARLQYRYGGPEGNALALEEPARVELDGELLPVDSSKMNGAWYETNNPVKNFNGRHSIIYTDGHKKQYKQEFNFNIFSLRTELPGKVKRDSLVFELDGLEPIDYIRVLLTDTSYYSRGIDRLDTVRLGKVIVTRRDLDNLKNGPVSVEFYREDEQSLQQTTREGGRLSISYGLKRVFVLED